MPELLFLLARPPWQPGQGPASPPKARHAPSRPSPCPVLALARSPQDSSIAHTSSLILPVVSAHCSVLTDSLTAIPYLQVYCRHLYTFSSCSSLNLCCRLIFAHTLPALSPQDSAIAHTTGVLSTSLHLLFVFFAQSWLSLPYLTYRCIVDIFTPSLRVLRSICAVA